MKKRDAQFLDACKTVTDFKNAHTVGWEAFAKLEAIAPGLSRLNRHGWKKALDDGFYGRLTQRYDTIKVAELIRDSPDRVLSVLGKTYTPAGLDVARLKIEVVEFEQLADFKDKPDALGRACIQYAGRGHHTEAFEELCKAFVREAPVNLDRAMLMLDSLVYLGYRCMTPRGFAAAIRNRVTPHLKYRQNTKKCSLLSRSRALAQLWCMANERGEVQRTLHIHSLTGVADIFDSDAQGVGVYTQLTRNRSVFESLRLGRGIEGLQLANDALKANPNDPGNKRAVAHVRAGALRRLTKPNYGEAWATLADYYESGRKDLLIAMSNPAVRPREMFHLFTSTYLGANMRSLSKESYPQEELAEDLQVIEWCMGQFKHEIQMDDISCIGECARLPEALANLRPRCTRVGFKGNIDAFDELVEAIVQVPT